MSLDFLNLNVSNSSSLKNHYAPEVLFLKHQISKLDDHIQKVQCHIQSATHLKETAKLQLMIAKKSANCQASAECDKIELIIQEHNEVVASCRRQYTYYSNLKNICEKESQFLREYFDIRDTRKRFTKFVFHSSFSSCQNPNHQLKASLQLIQKQLKEDGQFLQRAADSLSKKIKKCEKQLDTITFQQPVDQQAVAYHIALLNKHKIDSEHSDSVNSAEECLNLNNQRYNILIHHAEIQKYSSWLKLVQREQKQQEDFLIALKNLKKWEPFPQNTLPFDSLQRMEIIQQIQYYDHQLTEAIHHYHLNQGHSKSDADMMNVPQSSQLSSISSAEIDLSLGLEMSRQVEDIGKSLKEIHDLRIKDYIIVLKQFSEKVQSGIQSSKKLNGYDVFMYHYELNQLQQCIRKYKKHAQDTIKAFCSKFLPFDDLSHQFFQKHWKALWRNTLMQVEEPLQHCEQLLTQVQNSFDNHSEIPKRLQGNTVFSAMEWYENFRKTEGAYRSIGDEIKNVCLAWIVDQQKITQCQMQLNLLLAHNAKSDLITPIKKQLFTLHQHQSHLVKYLFLLTQTQVLMHYTDQHRNQNQNANTPQVQYQSFDQNITKIYDLLFYSQFKKIAFELTSLRDHIKCFPSELKFSEYRNILANLHRYYNQLQTSLEGLNGVRYSELQLWSLDLECTIEGWEAWLQMADDFHFELFPLAEEVWY